MSEPSKALVDLAAAHRVATSFTDWLGDERAVSAETLEAVLIALGADVTDPVAALHAAWEAPWRRMLPACVVAIGGSGRLFWVHVRDGAPVEVQLLLEGGGSRHLAQVDQWIAPRWVDDGWVGEATFAIPADVPLGYHRIRAGSEGTTSETALIVTPAWLGAPRRLGERTGWGVAAQLYSVRSAGSWGVGDLTDLTDLAVWAGADLGADYVLVNPLHAAEPLPPLEPSPYLPSTRRFFNPLYLRVEAVSEFAALPPRARARIAVLARRVRERAAATDTIDRDTAWTAKREALQLLHAVPRSAGRELDLAAFRRREGAALTDFATWSVLAETHGNDARAWPAALRDPRSPEVAAFAADHAAETDFVAWLQWLLDEQLERAQAKALGAGMAIGTMHDLAVGVHPGGADAWRLADTYADGVSVGAPPDPYNRLGQNWMQPPWRPDRLEEAAYAPFRDLIAAVLRHAGGVRVDHIIGLFRLWWVPAGHEADDGAYVYYDHEALIGVLALEAQRAGAVVVGEDLGVVDPAARRYFASRGILGTSILWFETSDGAPLPAEQWREWCLASVTTHDLPPTAGYLDDVHVRLRSELGLLPNPLDEELAADRAEREVWLEELRRRHLLSSGMVAIEESEVQDEAADEATVIALHRYLTLTPARLRAAALVDLVGDHRTQNQPGTVDEYPNWRVPLTGPDGTPMLLEDVFASARAARLAAVLRG